MIISIEIVATVIVLFLKIILQLLLKYNDIRIISIIIFITNQNWDYNYFYYSIIIKNIVLTKINIIISIDILSYNLYFSTIICNILIYNYCNVLITIIIYIINICIKV